MEDIFFQFNKLEIVLSAPVRLCNHLMNKMDDQYIPGALTVRRRAPGFNQLEAWPACLATTYKETHCIITRSSSTAIIKIDRSKAVFPFADEIMLLSRVQLRFAFMTVGLPGSRPPPQNACKRI
jgi:hypothetical protein